MLILLPGWLLSQSLGEIAEQEKAKRKKTGAKSYTNGDLDQGKASPSPSASPSASPGAPQPAPSSSPGPKTRFKTPPAPVQGQPAAGPKPQSGEHETQPSEREGPETKPKAPAKDEEHWRAEREAREKAIHDLQDGIKALERRIGELQGDLNPNAADVMDPDRLKKRDAELREKAEALERSKSALEQARQNLANLDEDARRAGVPAGWVR